MIFDTHENLPPKNDRWLFDILIELKAFAIYWWNFQCPNNLKSDLGQRDIVIVELLLKYLAYLTNCIVLNDEELLSLTMKSFWIQIDVSGEWLNRNIITTKLMIANNRLNDDLYYHNVVYETNLIRRVGIVTLFKLHRIKTFNRNT